MRLFTNKQKLSPGRTSDGKTPSIGLLFGDRSGNLFYMKQFIFVGLMVILTVASTYAQNKHDNVVIVKGSSFNDVIRMAVEKGMHPDRIDTIFKIASIPVGSGQTVYITENHCGDINITSSFVAAWMGNNQTFQVEYLKASWNQGRWKEVMKLASAFDNIQYARL